MAVPLSPARALDGLVRRLRLHSSLSSSDAAAIEQLPVIVAEQRRHSRLIKVGDYLTHCTFLVQGFAQRSRLTSTGGRQILGIYIPGDPLDLDHLFLPMADDDIQFIDNALVAYVRHADLRELLGRRPAVAEAVTRAILVDASIFREWIVNVGQRDAKARIAHLLCEISTRLAAQQINAETLPLPLTQDQIADATGLTAVHVNRTLRALSTEGWLRRRGPHVMLPRPDDLKELAGFDDQYLHIRG